MPLLGYQASFLQGMYCLVLIIVERAECRGSSNSCHSYKPLGAFCNLKVKIGSKPFDAKLHFCAQVVHLDKRPSKVKQCFVNELPVLTAVRKIKV